MAMTPTTLYRAEDLLALADDGSQYELVRGELLRMPASSFDHSGIGLNLGSLLLQYVRANKLGKVVGADGGFILSRDPDTVRVPDAAFVSASRLPDQSEWQRFLVVVPDLVAEVVSPSDRASEIANKVLEYLDAGVRLVWVLHPVGRHVTVYSADGNARVLREGDVLDGEDVVPGFQVAVADVFMW